MLKAEVKLHIVHGLEMMKYDEMFNLQRKLCNSFYNQIYKRKTRTGGTLPVMRKEAGHTADKPTN